MGKDSVDKTQEEILEEMAKALGHTGYKLEMVLEELGRISRQLEATADTGEYNALVDAFNTLRKQALMRRDMLMIHREAVGARKHNYLDKYYPIPNKREKKPEEKG